MPGFPDITGLARWIAAVFAIIILSGMFMVDTEAKAGRDDQELICPLAGTSIKLSMLNKLSVTTRVSADTPVHMSSSDPAVVSVSFADGEPNNASFRISANKAGSATVTIWAEQSPEYNKEISAVRVTVTKGSQSVTTSQHSYSLTCSKSVSLKATAKTSLTYSSSDPKTIKVDAKGIVTALQPGTARITAKAASTKIYAGASKTVEVKSTLAKPSLTLTNGIGKVKLTWTRVPGASQYEIYVKFPGEKEYRGVLVKDAAVKSVTHSGIKSGKRYGYRVRARVKIGGKWYYSPYSKEQSVVVR